MYFKDYSKHCTNISLFDPHDDPIILIVLMRI